MTATIQLPTLYRDISTDLGKPSVDLNTRMISGIFSSPAPVQRYDWDEWVVFDEILSQDAKDWDLTRVEKSVCPLLLNHYGDPVGIITSVEFKDDLGYFEAKISRSSDGENIINDYADGIFGGISFGYKVGEYEEISPAEYDGEGRNKVLVKNQQLLGKNITLYEISKVSIPADPNAGVSKRNEGDRPSPVTIYFKRDIQTINPSDMTTTRAKHEDLNVGDYVGWSKNKSSKSAKMANYGQIEKKNVRGTISNSDDEDEMDCSPDNPGFLVRVHEQQDGGDWKKTDSTMAHRAESLTKLDSLPSSKSSSAKSNEEKPLQMDELKKLQEENASLRSQLQQREGQITDNNDLRTQLSQVQRDLEGRDRDIQQRDEQLERLDSQMQSLQRSNSTNKRYNQLRQKADELLQEMKISAVEFNDLFGERVEDDVDRLLKSEEAEANGELGNIDFYLKKAEKRSPILPTQLRTGHAPLPEREPETEEEKRLSIARKTAADNYSSPWRTK